MKYTFLATKAKKYKEFDSWAAAEKHARLYRMETRDYYVTITWDENAPKGYTEDKERHSTVVRKR